ncbi:MAG: MATE family efflux transporter [Bacteroidales bacterium]|nr:MATE family efflux transporter [Bacteroidales bacterium]
MRKLTLNEQSALNIIGSIVVVAINVAINFLLSPFIVEHLGVEANGYITLANNFVSYIALVTMALNSMAGRFILIDYRKNNLQSVNEYYSSVLLGDWFLAAVFLVPMILFVIFIDRVINVPGNYLADTRILFAIVFVNYLVHLCLPIWGTSTYCTNNLYLRSLKNAVSSVVRAVAIYLLFLLFAPHSYYVAIAASLMSVVAILMDYAFYKRLMPELKWRVKDFRMKKVWELVSSGIWNTLSQCGNLLLEGLDILIANIFINPVMSGVLALSKVIPNMINQITGTVAATYGPRLTYLYADGKYKEMETEVKNDIMIVSFLANIPIGIFFVFGSDFFSLWVPSQNAHVLALLSSLTLVGMLFAGISQCFVNIFGIVNKLRLNSIVLIGTGLLNVLLVYLLLKNTDLGVYAIAAVSSVITVLRLFLFTAPYAARCINASGWRFGSYLLRGAGYAVVPVVCGLLIKLIPIANTWFTLLLLMSVTAVMGLLINFCVFLNKHQRVAILKLVHIKK